MSKKGIVLKTTKDSTPPGVLNADQIGRFKTIQEDIAELQIKSIQPCPLIPDYMDPTESFFPIVVQSPTGYHCIDGWRLIEEANAEGQSAICCSVIHIQEHSDTELALRKVEVRTKPRGGTCSYAERVRNTSILEKLIMDEMENPIVFSHGGARQGKNFSNNKTDDLIQVLSERLGNSRNTINGYLNFGRYLTDWAMDIMVAQKTGKDFFEKVRINKRNLIKDVESEGSNHEDLTIEVSRKMLEWLDEFQRTRNITPYYSDIEPFEEDNEARELGNEITDDGNGNNTEEFETFFQSPTVENDSPEFVIEENVIIEIQTIIEALSEIVEQQPIDCDQCIEIIKKQIGELAKVQHMLIDIRDQTQQNLDEEAA